MPPIVVYISDNSSTPTLDGRFLAFQSRWLTVVGNNATSSTATGDLSTVLGVEDFSFDDLGGVPFFNIDFNSTAEAEAFENDIDRLYVGLSETGDANKDMDDIVDLVYFDMSQGSRTGSRITWSNTDTGTTDLKGSTVNGDFIYLVCHTPGNEVNTLGILSSSVDNAAPSVGDVITFTRTHTQDTPDWDKWTVSGSSTENTDWQWVNGTNRYSASPEMEILTADHSITVDYEARWDGVGTGASPWTNTTVGTSLTISPVASSATPVHKMVGAWTGNFQFAASTSDVYTKQIVEPLAGAERWQQGGIRLWNGDDALNYGATTNNNRSVFSTSADCNDWWKGTDPTNFGNGFKVRVSFDNEATWIWLNASNSDAAIEGSTQTSYINTSGAQTNVIAAITSVSGGSQTDFYSGLPMVVEVYDV